jgi:hypothetical protein
MNLDFDTEIPDFASQESLVSLIAQADVGPTKCCASGGVQSGTIADLGMMHKFPIPQRVWRVLGSTNMANYIARM